MKGGNTVATLQHCTTGRDSARDALDRAVQFNKELVELRPPFMEMMKKFKFMRDGHFGWDRVEKSRFVLNSQDKPLINFAPYRAGLN